MKTILFLIISVTIACNAAYAETVYVTDDIDLTLRSAENNRSKILKMVRSGTPLTLIEKKDSGYSFVKTNSGLEGYFLSRHLKSKPTAKWFLDQANKKIQELTKINDSYKTELAALRGDNKQNIASTHELTQERDQLKQELNEIKLTASNAVELKTERDQLQARVVNAERELQKVKRDYQALQDNSNQDWFLYGGGLALIGVLIGFLMTKLNWRRRSSGWDTF